MADQLATPQDLAALLQQDLDASTANLVIDVATAVVQAAAGGQRILQVVDDPFTLDGTTDSWLHLPQIPVTAVASVTLDGTALTAGTAATNYRRRGNRLWRTAGWQTHTAIPSEVAGIYTHGYAAGAQRLQLARGAVLSIGKTMYANPAGVVREQIDDYSVAYAEAEAAMTEHLRAALRKQYGRRAALVQIGV